MIVSEDLENSVIAAKLFLSVVCSEVVDSVS